jgi:serine/threonine protein kinase
MTLQPRRYEFHEIIGRGGMGEVYRGTVVGPHGFAKPVAIKRLRRDLAADRRFVQRLVEEANLLVSLQHSNLVGVLDLGRSDDEVFIALEYVDGPNLGALIKRGPLPLGVATYVIRAACEGVAFAHEQRRGGAVIHADLSPSNVLLSRAGEVKVTDFGIARREELDDGRGIEGKLPYMSPEQARGDRLTPCSDVYSMGVVLYETLTGKRPFRAREEKALQHLIADEAPEPPRSSRGDIPAALEQACLRALDKDAGRRFDRIRDLGAALGDISFAQGWRDGPAELAALIAERAPPVVRRTTSMSLVLADLGLVSQKRRRTGQAPMVAGESLTGSVLQTAAEPSDELTRWTRQTVRQRRRSLRAVAVPGCRHAGGGGSLSGTVRRGRRSRSSCNAHPIHERARDSNRCDADLGA